MTYTSRTNNNLIEFVVRENVKISFFYVIQKDEYQQVCINRFIFYIASCLLASSKTMINKQVVEYLKQNICIMLILSRLTRVE